jgi:hypothetical protein
LDLLTPAAGRIRPALEGVTRWDLASPKPDLIESLAAIRDQPDDERHCLALASWVCGKKATGVIGLLRPAAKTGRQNAHGAASW